MEKSYGVNNQKQFKKIEDFYLEELSINGYTIVPNVLNEEELSLTRIKLDAVYDQQKKYFGEEKLELINEKNTVRCPLIYDDFFLSLARNLKVLNLIEKILGEYFILHLQNGIINKPNKSHHQSSWHRDLPYQNFVISNPLALSALYCIDDFTEDSGGTFVLPFSHKTINIPSTEFIDKYKKQVIAKAGSVILFDAMLFHRAGYNIGSFVRRAINNVYTVPIIKQQINLEKAFKEREFKDEELLRFLGYKSNVAESDFEWRENKFKKK